MSFSVGKALRLRYLRLFMYQYIDSWNKGMEGWGGLRQYAEIPVKEGEWSQVLLVSKQRT